MQSGLSFLMRCALFLAVLCFGYLLHGQELPLTPSEPPNYSESMTQLWQNLNQEKLILQSLSEVLMIKSKNAEGYLNLLNELTQLKQSSNKIIIDLENQLSASNNSLETMRKQLEEAKNYSDKLNDSIMTISLLSAEYKTEAEDQIRQLQRDRDFWRGFSLIAGIIAGLGLGYAGGHLAGVW